MLLLDHRRRGPDPYLGPKIALFVGGACSALAGIWTRREWPITLAIVLLALGLVLRFLPRRPTRSE